MSARFHCRSPGFAAAISTLAAVALATAAAVAATDLDFEKHIRPILEEHCFDCHGEEKQNSRLRLDSTVGILRGGESGEPLFVAGKRGESHLVKRVTAADKKVDKYRVNAHGNSD